MIHHHLPVSTHTPANQEQGRFHAVYCLMLALSDRCNLRCDYCFVEKTQRKMSVETARKAVDFFLHRNITGTKNQLCISFFGGEPFIELDLMEEVIAHVRASKLDCHKNVNYAATTNATLAGPRIEKVIRDAKMDLLISLDGGPKATSHRPFETGASSYAIVAKNLPKLVSWASQSIVRVTYHPGALDLVENARHALELGAPSVALAPVVESDWTGHEEKLEEAYQELADWFISEARAGRPLPLEGTWIYLRQLHRALQGGGRPGRPCAIATDLIGIEPDGNVMPCHRYLYRPQDWLGTVDKPHLSASRNQYLDLSSQQFLECSGCVAESICGGGCRAVTVQSGHGLYGVHPGYCLNTRAHARAVYRIYQTLMQEKNPSILPILRSRKNLGVALNELAFQ